SSLTQKPFRKGRIRSSITQKPFDPPQKPFEEEGLQESLTVCFERPFYRRLLNLIRGGLEEGQRD
ncbi:hypothetical protein, partial [Agrobacterium sp.]|uniref:hypothetical protein n=1 Tax=Agrobacterium sp. TaxID=361 RepID=UPI0040336004